MSSWSAAFQKSKAEKDRTFLRGFLALKKLNGRVIQVGTIVIIGKLSFFYFSIEATHIVLLKLQSVNYSWLKPKPHPDFGFDANLHIRCFPMRRDAYHQFHELSQLVLSESS